MWAFWGLVSSCRVEGVYNYFFFNFKCITVSKQGLQKHHTKQYVVSFHFTSNAFLFAAEVELAFCFVWFGFFSFCFGFGFFFLARRHK